jgi:peroxiredoxin
VALPYFEQMYRELGSKGLMIATVSTDSPDTAKTFAGYNKLTQPFLMDTVTTKNPKGKVSTAYHRWKGRYLIDSTGKIIENFEDGLTLPKVRAALAKLGVQ